MKRLIPHISLWVLLLSASIYVAGRWVIRNLMSDDTGDWFLWSGGISAVVLLYSKMGRVPVNIRACVNAGAASVSIVLAAFGAWGLFSAEGSKQFPEMAGLLPFYALLLAGTLFICVVIINVVWRRSLGKHGKTNSSGS
jgi:hypothetical protein